MQMVTSQVGDAKVLALGGRLDAEAASEFEARCQRLIEAGARTLILNLTALGYLSSAGLRGILSAGKSLQAKDGKLVLVAPPGSAREILELAGFTKMFPVCASFEEAGKHISGNFLVQHHQDWGTDILTVIGRVDAERAPELEAAGRRVLEAGHLKLVISLGGVQYLSSAGLCALLNLGKLAQARKCRIVLCGPVPSVREILKLSGFDKLFPIRATVAEGLVD